MLALAVCEGVAACLPACQVTDGAQANAQVLEKTSGHPKALYRRAQAHMGAGDYVEAEVDIKAALQVSAWLARPGCCVCVAPVLLPDSPACSAHPATLLPFSVHTSQNRLLRSFGRQHQTGVDNTIGRQMPPLACQRRPLLFWIVVWRALCLSRWIGFHSGCGIPGIAM